jgi:OmpA-OmpF porin, OOP family
MASKKLTITFIIFALLLQCNLAQTQVLKELSNLTKQKAKDRLNRRVDKTIDKVLDKVEDKIDNPSGNNKSNNKNNNANTDENSNSEEGNKSSNNKSNSTTNGLKIDSKFDYIPGEKIVLWEDFSKDAIGDFPDKWNTNGSGEIVNTNLADGHFLQTKNETIFYPTWLNALPDNFTLECDLMCSDNFNYYSQFFIIGFTSSNSVGKHWNEFGRFGHGGVNNHRIEIGLHPASAGMQSGQTTFKSNVNTRDLLNNDADQNKFCVSKNKQMVHVAIWRQKQRVRVYLDDKKVWDIPMAIEPNVIFNTIYFRNNGTDRDDDAYYISKIRVAVGKPDMRNKLITEGKYSTTGILFDVNSDKIKPESYGVIKEIALALSENTTTNIKVIGHTDSDGDEQANLLLSQKRALAVKNYLVKQFDIDASRIQTDGKGESVPVTKNDTPEAKAENRRVEFIKF